MTKQGRDCNAHNFTKMNQTKQHNMKMTVEIKRHGFELLNEQGEIVMTSEPANKGKLHCWLSNNGYKPSATVADQWEK